MLTLEDLQAQLRKYVLAVDAAGAALATALDQAQVPPVPVPSAGMSLLVPAYFAPSNRGWSDLVAVAAKGARVTAVANPSDGPGTAAQASYTDVLSRLAAAGGRPLGYVFTGYGARSPAEVKGDVDRWASFYPMLRGIFFDEQAAGTDRLAYYADLFTYARSKLRGGIVVGNPGTAGLAEAYLTDPAAADTYVVHEEDATRPLAAPPYAQKYPPSRFGALVFAATRDQMLRLVPQAKALGIGNVYVTNDADANVWDSDASYLTDEVAVLA